MRMSRSIIPIMKDVRKTIEEDLPKTIWVSRYCGR
jgi:hypothetical protein